MSRRQCMFYKQKIIFADVNETENEITIKLLQFRWFLWENPKFIT